VVHAARVRSDCTRAACTTKTATLSCDKSSMTHSNAVWYQLKPYVMAFRTHAKLWMIPTVVLTIGALVYASYMPTTWKASQTIKVRDETNRNQVGQGEFASIDWMKVYQEKILEVARSRKVVESVLLKLGPPSTHLPGTPWPSATDIAAMQSAISISPPKGLEFGTTDVIHLCVTGKTPEIALARCRVVYDELKKNLGDLRNANAESVIGELEQAQTLAQQELEKATSKLETLEREVGQDLGELRLLAEIGSGDSNLRNTLKEIQKELRDHESARDSQLQLKELLLKSQKDTTNLLATPSRLLESQPSLRSLKESLSAARIEISKHRGIMSESHPKLQQAIRTEHEVRRQLEDEVTTSLRGIEADLAANAAQINTMKGQETGIQQRLDKLAGIRAGYNNLIADTKQRTEILNKIKQELADARASKNAATSNSQMIPFGEPNVGDRPVGPGKKMVVLGGMASGLTLGAGLVFLFMPIGPTGGNQRWADYMNMGRRATDHLFGRRATDFNSPSSNVRTTDVVGVAVRKGENGNAYLSHSVVGGRRSGDIPPAPVQPEPAFPEVDRRAGTGRRAADQADMLP
jgi:succinoglycan biosynthesis transport protein ExoP